MVTLQWQPMVCDNLAYLREGNAVGPDDNEMIPVADRVAGQVFVDIVGIETRKHEHLPDIGKLLELAEIAWQASNAFMFARSQKDKVDE